MERRFVEFRADDAGLITGVVAPYNIPATIGRFSETILPGAFSPLADEVRVNIMHERARPIARNVVGGGLVLTDSGIELRATLTLPDTVTGVEARELIARRVLTGFSVEMKVTDDVWRGTQRTVRAATLRNIGLVDCPAHVQAQLDLEKRWKDSNGQPHSRRRRWL